MKAMRNNIQCINRKYSIMANEEISMKCLNKWLRLEMSVMAVWLWRWHVTTNSLVQQTHSEMKRLHCSGCGSGYSINDSIVCG